MKHITRTYALVGRVAHSAASPLLKRYFVERVRVRTLVLSKDGKEVLLVKSWFGHQKWSLPGGGIRRGEALDAAAARELYEETGIRVSPNKLHHLGTFRNGDSHAPFRVECFMVHVDKQPTRLAHHQRLEMLDMSWFPLGHLPEAHSTTVANALHLRQK